RCLRQGGGVTGSGMTARGKVPPLRLEVLDHGRPRTERKFLRRVVRAALLHGGRPAMPVSLLLTDDHEIARIHGEYLDDPTPTDVISFDIDDTAELVVSVETARRIARECGHPVRSEVALYIVHGILHVCGFDDIAPRDRARMRAAERAVMQTLRLDVRDVDADKP
ncbi:MAG: rRNA maturation RNase YbeY, partial [Planctomycetes bacterium]|nr:rRNA maturation RNase YbeY [Planctomycetota bacterium]